MQLPISRINPVLTRIAFPVLTRVRDDKERLKRGYFRVLDLLISVNAPVMMGVVAVAPLLPLVVLGDQWLPIVPLMQVLALFSLLYSTGNVGGSLVLACGRADLALYWNLMKFMIVPLAIVAGAKVGALQGVVWTLLGLQVVWFFGWYYVVTRRLLGSCFSGFIGSMIKPVLFAILMSGAVVGVAPFLSTLSAVMQLAVLVLFGCLVYVGIYCLFRKEFVKEQWQLFFNKQ